jgi:hypothetical protein
VTLDEVDGGVDEVETGVVVGGDEEVDEGAGAVVLGCESEEENSRSTRTKSRRDSWPDIAKTR